MKLIASLGVAILLYHPPGALAQQLPPGWTSAGIGSGSGTATHNGGTFTLSSSSAPLGGSATADSFHFTYQTVTGDFDIVTRLESTFNGYDPDRLAFMVREKLTPGSRQAYIFRGGRGGGSEKRLAENGANAELGRLFAATPNAAGEPPEADRWYRIVRYKDNITIFRADRTGDWDNIYYLATSTFPGLAQTLHIGYGVGRSQTNTTQPAARGSYGSFSMSPVSLVHRTSTLGKTASSPCYLRIISTLASSSTGSIPSHPPPVSCPQPLP
jgi:hypothetical protein